jgi:hypothetical protein
VDFGVERGLTSTLASALRRLAIQGHDTNRELEFHAREIQSERRVSDWPRPRNVRNATEWPGVLRYHAGWAYRIFSGFRALAASPLSILVRSNCDCRRDLR